MSHNDDFDDLLKPLEDLSVSDLQMQKWQLAVQREARKSGKLISTTRTRWALQLVAAMFVGFVVGVLAFRSLQQTDVPTTLTAQFSSDNATFERSHTNLD